MSVVYGILTGAAIFLLVGYMAMVKQKEPWLLFLFCCVPVVNLGYLLLSLATNKAFALVANHTAYFGSVFLSLCMFMVILRLCGFAVAPAAPPQPNSPRLHTKPLFAGFI